MINTKMWSPKISIITVCYNEIDRIEKTLISVINQTYPNIEYIVVDGGSNDGTIELLEKYKSHISHLVSEKDSGIYHAMNKGALLSGGDYLLYMNGGDWLYESQTLEKIIRRARPSDIIYGDRYKKYGDSLIYKKHPSKINQFYLLMNGIICHQSALISKNLFDKLDGYNSFYKIMADYDFFVRAKKIKNAEFLYVNQIVCVFNADGISHDKTSMCAKKHEKNTIRKSNYCYFYYLAAIIRDKLCTCPCPLLKSIARKLYPLRTSHNAERKS